MALQNLCLQVIAHNFEKCYLAFSTCDDAGRKRQLQFLQRVYSDEIAPIVFGRYTSQPVPAHFTDFLINKNLTVLNTQWMKDCTWEYITEKFAQLGSNFETIYFYSENPWQNIMEHLTNLKDARFKYFSGNDEILKCLANFSPNLIHIDLTFCVGVTDTGLKCLCMKKNDKIPCPKLKKVFINCSHVTMEGVLHLVKNLRSLEEIDYYDIPTVLYLLHKNDLSKLDKIEPYNFTNLDLQHLENSSIYNELLNISLSLCPRVNSLSLPIFQEGNLELFSNLNELQKLHVICGTDSNVNINNLLGLGGKKLISLSIVHNPFPVSAIVKSCPCLSFLQLSYFQINNHIPPFNDCTTAQAVFSSVLEQIVIMGFNTFPSEWKADFLKCCGLCPIMKISFIFSQLEMNFLKEILMTCHSLTCFSFLDTNINCDDELELCNFAQLLPNNPEIKRSVSGLLEMLP